MTNPYAPPRAVVRDVRDPQAQAEPAGRGTRLGAAILDGIIVTVMVYVPILFFPAIGAAASPGAEGGSMIGIGMVLGLAGFIIWCWLTITYVYRNGQTIGKKLVGIKVVRSDGTPISLSRIFWLRNVVNAMLGIIPLYGLIDVLFIFGESRQCLHDKLADTVVVVA
ncbi:MAG TPA: RDD family protein [Vicinamibacterales bacterium]|nr:RDD family protein [Vicinamibacterales bacterium]